MFGPGEILWIERPDGAAVAHKVRAIEPGRKTTKIVLLDGSGARHDVPTGDLTPAAPVTAAERAEYHRLDAELAGTIGDSRKLRRFNMLRLRWIVCGEAA
ncbi:MAG TPA: hypothetical protein VF605_11785 [Allosphingosinicella sp.]|jgi:hypothetical protein